MKRQEVVILVERLTRDLETLSGVSLSETEKDKLRSGLLQAIIDRFGPWD